MGIVLFDLSYQKILAPCRRSLKRAEFFTNCSCFYLHTPHIRFAAATRGQPQDACKFLQDFAGCYQLVFEKAVPELGWMMCELARAFGSSLGKLLF